MALRASCCCCCCEKRARLRVVVLVCPPAFEQLAAKHSADRRSEVTRCDANDSQSPIGTALLLALVQVVAQYGSWSAIVSLGGELFQVRTWKACQALWERHREHTAPAMPAMPVTAGWRLCRLHAHSLLGATDLPPARRGQAGDGWTGASPRQLIMQYLLWG